MGLGRLEDNATLHSLRAIDQGKYSVLAGVGRKLPLIIQLFPWTIPSSNGILVHAAAQAARQASIPVAVHLDHCQDEDMVKQACLLSFDPIMIDMKTLGLAGLMTTTEEAQQFVDAEVNLIAPAFGNVHRDYGPRDIVLDLERLSYGYNINQDILAGYYAHLEQKVNKIPFTQLVDDAVKKAAETLARRMDAVGSSRKA
ncbi:hypothetical protein M441DRAFT_65820 [Trichoderma asperellum CBS 433.97]|uniref:Fructose-bisphosphate aldolase n=1 Tax=Trichoderma asperellum (strain ATCC 204424 / CBS 433.97 / NBRC 101777) TaxID=1042311 RepID=A0A2T3ZGW8_TRIA4|nr:hypothetical protein M441DRAFT_65820 [Trichoderma asperellum CBS 433.97]PTB44048.1 hypothetical protein M441DRAFT_65820 [Trichoderma asperellum CBS 433.97]